MLRTVGKVNKALWAFIELGFLLVLLAILIFLILGQSSGVVVLAVMDNIFALTGKVDAANFIGIAIIIALVYVVKSRLKV
ncbi:MAG TPA: hypothetical protein DCS82_07600 [Rhodospirillaceae bacterium]|mgnify:CR=1 FL=1|nr:hypothetical protein [Rhodospirillaceae bacterium]|tara:strand:- start:90 stop:329 length:240 start_codon:yes stop_codon:yes gene_type:complete